MACIGDMLIYIVDTPVHVAALREALCLDTSPTDVHMHAWILLSVH
jgi:hypothetical protein